MMMIGHHEGEFFLYKSKLRAQMIQLGTKIFGAQMGQLRDLMGQLGDLMGHLGVQRGKLGTQMGQHGAQLG